MPLPNPFPVARYRIRSVVERRIEWPDFEGSALRGVYGHALRHAACVTRAPTCEGCSLLRTCPYPVLFDTPPPAGARRTYSDIPPPYVLEPPLDSPRVLDKGASYDFGLVLIGPALIHLPLVMAAWRHGLALPIGPVRGGARMLSIHLGGDAGDLGEPLAEGSRPGAALRPHEQAVPLPPSDAAPEALTLHFRTPLRIKRGGQVLNARQIEAPDVLFALVRRIADLTELQLGADTGFDFAALKRAAHAVSTPMQAMQPRAWSRWSNRQQQRMQLDGAVGRITLQGDLRPFWPLLHLGQWVHLGGKTSFGLGRYELEAIQ